MYCIQCGTKLPDNAKLCSECGKRQKPSSAVDTGGGAFVDKNVDTGGGTFVGRDYVTLGKNKRDEQYDIVLNWEKLGKPLLRNFDLTLQDLTHINLDGSDLRGANLQGVDLTSTSLTGADLTNANLEGANLHRVNLEGAKLLKVNLKGARLSLANLQASDLLDADLERALFMMTNLREADLRRANLWSANLREWYMGGIKKVLRADLQGAIYDKNTVWTKGFDPKALGAIEVDVLTGLPVNIDDWNSSTRFRDEGL